MNEIYLPTDWDSCPEPWRNFITEVRSRYDLDMETVADKEIERELEEYSVTGYNPDQTASCTLRFNDEQKYFWFMLRFS